MTGPAQPPASLTLPTFLIGPQAGGRSYTLLKTPEAVARSAAAGDRLGDLALSLHRWSRSGEGGLVAFLPLDETQGLWALVRATSLGASDMGSVALLRGAVLGEEDLAAIGWKPHRLLAGFAPPTYAMAGAAASDAETIRLTAATASAVSGLAEVARSLSHTDRTVGVPTPTDAEPLLSAILEAVSDGGGRVEGWSAGGLLQRNGRFDPADVFRLVIVPQFAASVAAALPRHAPADLVAGRIASADVAVPRSWAAWQALFGIKAREYRIDPESDARLAAAHWRPELRELSPEEVVRRQAVLASESLDPIRPIAILHRLALATDKMPDAELARDARRGLALAFGDIVRPDAAVAAGQIEGYLTYVQPHLGGALPAQPASLALETGAIERLPAATVAQLASEGIARGLFDRTVAFLDVGGRLGDDQAVAMLQALAETGGPRAAPGRRELLLRLTARALALAPRSPAARRAALGAIAADDLVGDVEGADRLCEPLWSLLQGVDKRDGDYAPAVAIGRRLAESAHAALREAPGAVRPARLIRWTVRLTGGRARAA